MILIWTGLPGAGKGVKLSLTAVKTLERNKRWREKYKTPIRKIAINATLSKELKEKWKEYIIEWDDPLQLIDLRGVDIFWDEIASYLDSTEWKNVDPRIRHFLRLHRHFGIDIYGTTQDLPTVDISMRRLIKGVYRCSKLIGSPDPDETRPPIKHPWGIIAIRAVKREAWKKEAVEYTYQWFPEIIFITKKKVSAYDTQQELIAPKAYPPLKHIERKCPDCGEIKISHT